MPNTIITPSLIAARALATLYNAAVLAGLVYRDYDPEFTGKQGDTVNVRTPALFVAKEFDRSNGIELQDITEGSFPVTLDTILDVSFPITAEELTLDLDNIQERVIAPAMEAIVQDVDGRLAEQLVDAANASGGGGVVDDDGGEPRNVSINARTTLGRKKIPSTERYAVVSPEAAGEMLKDELFVRADASGDTDGLREASIGRKFGFDHYESQVFGFGGGDKGSADGVAFHRTAVALVSRTLELPRGKTADQAAVESYKGLGLRVVWDYDQDKKQDVCSIDFLCGFETIRKQAAVELDYGQGS